MFLNVAPPPCIAGQQLPCTSTVTSPTGQPPPPPHTHTLPCHRLQYKRGQLSEAEYQAAMRGHIAHAVGVQEALDLDVLVHGEAERTDMVEYFGTKLQGLAFSQHGWVQSYGSRYVR